MRENLAKHKKIQFLPIFVQFLLFLPIFLQFSGNLSQNPSFPPLLCLTGFGLSPLVNPLFGLC